VEQCLVGPYKEVNSYVDELNRKLSLALRRVKDAEAQAEEECDEVAIVRDMVTESIMESKRKIKTLRCKLKDTH
ncbi:hypothetical protein BHE74_00059155, partial [Ensete ventricosum]